MTSVLKTLDMPAPSLAEIHEYKSYLRGSRLVAEETRFLDVPEDLVSLVTEETPVAEELAANVGGTAAAAPRLSDEGVTPARAGREAGSEADQSTPRRPRNGMR